MVFYTWGEAALGPKFDPDFGKEIEWDIPLLEGYKYKFLKNTSKQPGSHHFKGIINPTLNQEIETWVPDVVWVWGWAFDSHLMALRYFNGKVPVWFRGDSTLLDETKGFSIKKIARRVFLRWVYGHVDKAFYVGTNNKNYYLAHGLKPSQLVNAPHAIDYYRFAFDNDELKNERLKFKESIGVKENDILILFAGKLEPRKNPLFLIEMMRNLNLPQLKLLVVGNGPLLSKLKSELSHDPRVIFHDFINQKSMPNLYKTASFLVLPSQSETWGLAINESLAAGTPVIATRKCGGAIDLINSDTGIILDDLVDWEKLALEISKFHQNERPIVEAQKFIREYFSYDNIIAVINKQLIQE